MIELITGTPGAGKTLWALANVKARSEKENRPVFYSGIPELTLPWAEIDPEKWFDAPPNSIVVIDECQRVFRPRAWAGQVPEYVAKLETHRHMGIDLVFITQHPMLMDSNVRRLVGRHFHVARRFGMKRATVLEFESCKDQPLAKLSTAAVKHEWSYPKEVFSYYKSAEVHTHKARIPARLYWILAFMLVVGGSIYGLVKSFEKKIHPDEAAATTAAAHSASVPPGQIAANPYKYFQDRAPRLPGLAFSAPVYDEVMKPVTAPLPVACVSSRTRCVCNSQQGTRLDVPQDQCRSIVANGFFDPSRPAPLPAEEAARRPRKPGGDMVSGDAKPAVAPPLV